MDPDTREGSVTALVDVRPYASDDGAVDRTAWVASDLTPGLDTRVTPMRPDFVLGVSSASATLAQLTVRRPVGRALDLGTGCGVQSLHLARHAREVVATDLNPRALALARLTADLNGVAVDLRHGDLYAPVAGERFDLVVTNPPYVLSPPTGERLTYREGTRTSDGLVEAVVRQGAEHLTDGGVLQVLANWAHVRGEDWRDRVGGWVPDGLDLHVVEREVLDPAAYVELWLADAGLTGAPDYRERYAAWCTYFDDLGHRGRRDGLAARAAARHARSRTPHARDVALRGRAAGRAGLRARAGRRRAVAGAGRRRPARRGLAARPGRGGGDGGSARRRRPVVDRPAPAARAAPRRRPRHRAAPASSAPATGS